MVGITSENPRIKKGRTQAVTVGQEAKTPPSFVHLPQMLRTTPFHIYKNMFDCLPLAKGPARYARILLKRR